jgi:hypothetical protein
MLQKGRQLGRQDPKLAEVPAVRSTRPKGEGAKANRAGRTRPHELRVKKTNPLWQSNGAGNVQRARCSRQWQSSYHIPTPFERTKCCERTELGPLACRRRGERLDRPSYSARAQVAPRRRPASGPRLAPPAENKTPGGPSEQRGEKIQPKEGGSRSFFTPNGPPCAGLGFCSFFVLTAKSTKWRPRSTFGRAHAAQKHDIPLGTRGNAAAMPPCQSRGGMAGFLNALVLGSLNFLVLVRLSSKPSYIEGATSLRPSGLDTAQWAMKTAITPQHHSQSHEPKVRASKGQAGGQPSRISTTRFACTCFAPPPFHY